MPKLPVLSTKDVITALSKAGFVYAPKKGKGSHVAMVKKGTGRTLLVIVPKRKTIPKSTLMAIIKQAGLTKEEFLSLL
jgi:predicted RNA binding protein YcfA (HicA-like mRNA interferase family)